MRFRPLGKVRKKKRERKEKERQKQRKIEGNRGKDYVKEVRKENEEKERVIKRIM